MNFSPSCRALGTSIGFQLSLADRELAAILNNEYGYADISLLLFTAVIFLTEHEFI